MARLDFGAVVEVRDVVGGRPAFDVWVGSHRDAVSCCGRLPGGCERCGRVVAFPVAWSVVFVKGRSVRSARGLFSDRCVVKVEPIGWIEVKSGRVDSIEVFDRSVYVLLGLKQLCSLSVKLVDLARKKVDV